MQEKIKRLGVMGGTFDPIHNGHLIIAQEIREKFNLDRILFIPSGKPPHKKLVEVSCPEHRLNMVNIAVSTNPYFELSGMEVDRQGYTYTVDTLKELKKLYGDGTSIFFITGADVVLELETWRDFEAVFGLCEFIAVLRPGYKKDVYESRIQDLKEKYMARINNTVAPLIEISSTEIRERVKLGRPIKYLVPEGVEAYITENGLYKEKSEL